MTWSTMMCFTDFVVCTMCMRILKSWLTPSLGCQGRMVGPGGPPMSGAGRLARDRDRELFTCQHHPSFDPISQLKYFWFSFEKLYSVPWFILTKPQEALNTIVKVRSLKIKVRQVFHFFQKHSWFFSWYCEYQKWFFCTSLRNLCFPTRSRNIFTYKKCQ